MKPFVLKIGGEAGYGIMSAGLVVAKIASRSGYYTFDYSEYPSLVRGGHNVMQVAISEGPVLAPYMHTDFLVALNQDTLHQHQHEVIGGGSILFDSAMNMSVKNVAKGVHIFDVPIHEIATRVGGSLIMKNTAALGAVLSILGGSIDDLCKMIKEEFRDKHESVSKRNIAVARAAYQYVQERHFDKLDPFLKQKRVRKEKIVVTANEAIALGSIAAGMQFAAIYPMTPTSAILHTLAPHQEKFGYIYKQPEDEISALNMAIGASFAGVRSLVATSGGGFCLMTEAYGLAGITETPVVIIEGMRGAPATGLPTWTEQGDLLFTLYAHQGDFPRIILAPGDVEESFHMTMQAFNLAEKYQTPVLLLVDKHICESHMSVEPFEYKKYSIERGNFVKTKRVNYKRYAVTASGISPRSIPGVGNHFVVNSDEHDEVGYSEESSENRIEQMNKRMRKLLTCEKEDMEKPRVYGSTKADITIISWGSNKGAILEALQHCKNVNFVHVTWMNPFPTRALNNILKKAKKVLLVECNYSGQFGKLLKEKTGFTPHDTLLKYDGRPIFPEEIIQKIQSLLDS